MKRLLITFLILISIRAVAEESPTTAAVVQSSWIPMCFLFDPSVDATKANKNINEMVKAYGECGIQLRPFTYTLTPNYPRDPQALKAAAVAACPLNAVFGVRGAVQVVTDSPNVAKEMCKDPNAKGCSTLCSPISFSVLSPEAGPEVALHESMHSNCCGPVCVDAGQGTGINGGMGTELARYVIPSKSAWAGNIPEGTSSPISPEGCKALRAGASVNQIRDWDDTGDTDYYVVREPSTRYDFSSTSSVFGNAFKVTSPAPSPFPRMDAALPPSVPVQGLLEKLKYSKPAPVRNPAAFGKPVVLPGAAAVQQATIAPEPIYDFPAPKRIAEDPEALDAAGVRGKPGDSLRRSTGSGINRIDPYAGSGGGDVDSD